MTNVRTYKTLTVASLLLLVVTSPVVAQPPKGFAAYEGLKEQFVLSLPLGWSVFNQQEILTGNAGKVGPVVFCSETIDAKAMLSGDEKALEKVMNQLVRAEVGMIAGFMLDRLPAKKGMSCKGFEKKAQKELLKLVGTDPMFGPGRTTREKPRAEAVTIGGCEGLRIKGKGEARTGAGKMLDVFAVSDGNYVYLFMLLNLDEHYAKNVGIFEEVLSTLTLTASPFNAPDAAPENPES